MTTVGKMITQTRGKLQSWADQSEQSTTLSATIGTADATFSVLAARGIATGISPGTIEIDSELMFLEAVDTANGACTVAAWGRGYEDTTPAIHLGGRRVISNPSFPRSKILDEMNTVMGRIYPKIFAVKQIETIVNAVKLTYPLPSDAERVLYARWQVPGPEEYWQDVRFMRFNQGLGTLSGDTGRSVDFGDSMMPGRPLQIVYQAQPGLLSDESAEFATATSLGNSIEDVIVLGAAAALVEGLELSRLQTSSIEQQNRSQLVAPSAALTSSRFLNQRFSERLSEEQDKLRELFPPRIARSWR